MRRALALSAALAAFLGACRESQLPADVAASTAASAVEDATGFRPNVEHVSPISGGYAVCGYVIDPHRVDAMRFYVTVRNGIAETDDATFSQAAADACGQDPKESTQ